MLGATSDLLGRAILPRVDSGHRVMERRTFLAMVPGSLLAAPLAAPDSPTSAPPRPALISSTRRAIARARPSSIGMASVWTSTIARAVARDTGRSTRVAESRRSTGPASGRARARSRRASRGCSNDERWAFTRDHARDPLAKADGARSASAGAGSGCRVAVRMRRVGALREARPRRRTPDTARG
jgi:hypothetical protein